MTRYQGSYSRSMTNVGFSTGGFFLTGARGAPGSLQARYQRVNRADHPDARWIAELVRWLDAMGYHPSGQSLITPRPPLPPLGSSAPSL